MKRTVIFVDIGAWIALMNANDQYHIQVAKYYRLLEPHVKLVTSSHVISETYTWLRYKAGIISALAFISVIRQAVLHSRLSIVLDHPDVLELAEQLLADFSDQKLSYTDAISMAIMKNENITRVFGFDRHFHLMRFELVPSY